MSSPELVLTEPGEENPRDIGFSTSKPDLVVRLWELLSQACNTVNAQVLFSLERLTPKLSGTLESTLQSNYNTFPGKYR